MPSAASSHANNHSAAAARRLAHLAGIGARTHAAEQRILEGATARRAHVDEQLARLRPRAIQDPAAGSQYQELTLERGQLDTVIAQSQRVLSPAARDGSV